MPAAFLEHFALDAQALSIVGSLVHNLVQTDVEETDYPEWIALTTPDGSELKADWVLEWENLVFLGLKNVPVNPRPTMWSERDHEFAAAFDRMLLESSPLVIGLILLEVAGFDAYWPMNSKKMDVTELCLIEDLYQRHLRRIAKRFNFPECLCADLRSKIDLVLAQFKDHWDAVRKDHGGSTCRCGPRAMALAPSFLIGPYTPENLQVFQVEAGLASLGLSRWPKPNLPGGRPLAALAGGASWLNLPTRSLEDLGLRFPFPTLEVALLDLAKLLTVFEVLFPAIPNGGPLRKQIATHLRHTLARLPLAEPGLPCFRPTQEASLWSKALGVLREHLTGYIGSPS